MSRSGAELLVLGIQNISGFAAAPVADLEPLAFRRRSRLVLALCCWEPNIFQIPLLQEFKAHDRRTRDEEYHLCDTIGHGPWSVHCVNELFASMASVTSFASPRSI